MPGTTDVIFGDNRDELRNMYVQAWRLYRAGQPMSPLEAQIAAVIAEHPEYHDMLSRGDVDREFTPEDGAMNPFLHLGLHLAVREQVSTNRPAGIRDIHERLAAKAGDVHEAEHRMLECLGESIWEAQRSGTPPDEFAYLEKLRRLV
jgi:hypothetical protein